MQNASFFSSSLVERRPTFDFVDLYIPANPFHSLANNVVPAVVLFSVILGIGLVGVERKERAARRPAGRERRDLARHALRESPHAVWTVCDCGERGRDDGPGATEPPADLSRGVRRGGAAGEPVGAAGTGRRAHADSSQGHPRRVARRADDRLHRRRPVHRAARPHAGEPARCSTGSIPATASRAG